MARSDARPNLLLINCHDLGDYLGCHGQPTHTPRLNALAERGVVLDRHFSTATVCSPARTSVLTGCYPHTHGVMGLVHRGWELDANRCPPLPLQLAQNGYETHLFGYQHEHWNPTRLGYQQIHPVASHHAEDVTPSVEQWLTNQARQTNAPFMASVGFVEAHRWDLPSHFRRHTYGPADVSTSQIPGFLPPTSSILEDVSHFYGAVQFIDTMVGRIVDALDKTGLINNTLILFYSDHGPSFFHAKGTLYDAGTKVACIMHWPKGLLQGRRIEALTSHVDLAPTLLSLVGQAPSQPVDGVNLAPLLRNNDNRSNISAKRQAVFAQRNYTNACHPARMIRNERFKYIRNGIQCCLFDFLIPELEQQEACDWRTDREIFNFYDTTRRTEELYDLTADPYELRSLENAPDYRKTLQHMRQTLDAHLHATADPFAHYVNPLQMQPDGLRRAKCESDSIHRLA